jgi:malectin (di-glucose binding ER protein)
MSNEKHLAKWLSAPFFLALTVFLLAGCQSSQTPSGGKTTATPAVAPAAPAASEKPDALRTAIRIDAGATTNFTDSSGNVWLADQGFTGGEIVTRADDLQIAGTKDPAIYRTEHYDMTAFSWPVPNGKYIVKLHFAETYEGITGAGERVFSFNVGGHEFKDFDVWAKTGGGQRADVETVNVEVTDGKIDITFTPGVQSPEINGIEIIPAS